MDQVLRRELGGPRGFYYSRYPEPTGGHELSAQNTFAKVYFHRLGEAQASDTLVYEDKTRPKAYFGVGVTEDEKYAVLVVSDPSTGKKGNSVFFRNQQTGETKWTPIVADISDDEYDVIDNVGSKFLVLTNHGAARKKILLYDPANAEAPWSEVIGEKPEAIESAEAAGGKLFVTYLKDVTTRAYVYSLTGKLENEIALPGLGTATGFGGNHDDPFVFYTFTSFNFPPTIFRYQIATRQSAVFRTPEIPGFDPAKYEEHRVFFTSKDGTRCRCS